MAGLSERQLFAAQVEPCACGGQIVAIASELGILRAVRDHQDTRRHQRWRRWAVRERWGRCEAPMRAGSCARYPGHRGFHRSRRALDNDRLRAPRPFQWKEVVA